MNDSMTPRQRAIDEAARVWAAGCARQAALSPREAAEEAYVPGGEYMGASIDQFEDKIHALRGLPPLDRSGPKDTSPPTGRDEAGPPPGATDDGP